MQCCGFTKNKKRCLKPANYLFCDKHIWQPVTAVIVLISIAGFAGGFFQDIIRPVWEKVEKESELKKALTVEIRNNRRTVAEWENNPDPTAGKSDVVTILLDRQPVKSLEMYHMVKDQRFKDYPPTFLLADLFLPTAAEQQVVDLDGDGINEVVITLSNQLYSLHPDQQLNVLIYSPAGELLARTPYPQTVPGLAISLLNPYSAYKTTVAMRDEITGTTQSSTFANDFRIVTRAEGKVLRFSWVIDNAGYAGTHLHQVEEFVYKDGKLSSVSAAPALYVSDSWGDAISGQPASLLQAKEFLEKHNQPKFSDMVQDAKKYFPPTSAPSDKAERPPLPPPRPTP